WNPQATWYVARSILGVLGMTLRNPYPLRRQKAFVVPGIVPENLVSKLEEVPTWDEWDPDHDRWYCEYKNQDWAQLSTRSVKKHQNPLALIPMQNVWDSFYSFQVLAQDKEALKKSQE